MSIEEINRRIYPYLNYIYYIINNINIQIPSYSVYHDTISLIISQQISFRKSREIRRNMFEMLISENLPKFTYEFINFKLSSLYKQLGISDSKYQTMRSIPNVPDVKFTVQELENYIAYISNIKGIGNWTCNALRVINRVPNSYLSDDSYIQTNIKNLLGIENLGKSEVEYIVNTFFSRHRLEFTILFWRIKKESIDKMKNFREISQDDFL